ncbi:MAG TPA: protein kinase [Oscillatoriaceae cyanobacterium M33_DOE_052]|uniref:non-specific serine/threonine protein kinase n=1 Tax=Planktothricoides sp. SpSt-374 TaxID=2282167 RepID=A0A7C3VED2_9CYAN|nr:protein kinase [Oscillatoriaceae cyanobacterium M33_DOE_052]
MTYCLHPQCTKPRNQSGAKFCQHCGAKLLLREHYRALEPIGQGGFGKTFLAVDEDRLKTRCVIKQFLPQELGTKNAQKAAELFHREAVRLDELGQHSQIPALLSHFEQDGFQYLVQEFIDGQNLAVELVNDGCFTEAKIRQLLLDLLPLLQFVHEKGVIHRDIKPENIIRRQGDKRLVLVDFGAAKVWSATALVEKGTIIGSPEYMAPEQLDSRATFASDIYSLGVTCLHLLTQMPPFELRDNQEDCWVWRDYLPQAITEQMAEILDQMVERPTNKRYQSATEVWQDLTTTVNSIYYTIDALTPDSKRLVGQQIFDVEVAMATPVEVMTGEIYQFLETTAKLELKRDNITEWQIICLWRKQILEIVEKLEIDPDYQKEKEGFLDELRELGKDDRLRDKMRCIVKNISILVYNALDATEKEEFWEKVIEDLRNNQINVAADTMKKAGIKGILFGTAGVSGLMAAIVSRIILVKLTKGLLTGVLLNLIGRHAFGRVAVGVLGGPIGLGINLALAAGGVIHGVSSYRKEKRKAKFIQGIFAIYLLAS